MKLKQFRQLLGDETFTFSNPEHIVQYYGCSCEKGCDSINIAVRDKEDDLIALCLWVHDDNDFKFITKKLKNLLNTNLTLQQIHLNLHPDTQSLELV